MIFRVGHWLAAILVLASLAAGSAAAQNPSLVVVDPVRYEPLTQTVPVIGRLVSLRAGNLAARVAAPVKQIHAEVGDRVSTNQPVVQLDEEIIAADLRLAESELAEAEADLATWRAEAELARTEHKRQEGLRTSPAFSQAKHEDAQKRVAVAVSKVERAEANVRIKRSAVERKRLDLEYATVRAPYDGIVVQRFTEVGAFVNKGDPVVKLIGDRALEVEADVPFARLAGLTVGRVVDVQLDDGTRHRARVRSVLPSENPLTRTRLVRFEADFSKTKRPLAESQSVTVSVPVGSERRVLTVHKDAILKRPNGDMVYVVEDDVAHARVIKLGEEVGSRIEVVSGLSEDDKIVVRGNERLQPGAKVRVEKGSS